MKICMLGWEFPPKISGGLARHCYALARELVLLGNDVYITIPRKNAPKENEVDGIKIVKVDYKFEKKTYTDEVNTIIYKYPKNVFNCIKNLGVKFDIVHAHDWMNVNAAIKIKKFFNIPFVLTIHSSELDRSGGVLLKKSRVLKVEGIGIKNADLVITVSKHMAEQIKNVFKVKRDIQVVYNGIDPAKEDIVRKEKDYVLFVGRLTEQKGVEYLIYALLPIFKKYKKLKLYVVGKGHLKKSLEKLTELLGIKRNVKFLGFVSDEKLVEYYKGAKLLAMPSLYEPFGIVALEAMKYKVPTIISKRAGVVEMLKDGENTILVDPMNTNEFRDAIYRYLKDEGLRKRIGMNGYMLTNEISWKEIALKTFNLYKSLVST
ncbi:MAG: glycosyltransferase family 4 protein [Candidatus Parvarchaeota archaeon]|nr:glycosyltransferase family 4 protein [Candidatus Jingweiarchaeum tengchongense]MCW1298585.1 glycosyltransferase family 4 protein [Candidatus Jingweiarchaeum tengchongense]MCW1300431.1 glycosyltransferase family 4 protein [Candidatus Jingweiarchaeum tengchongense]MCW1304609.1 glycosyltransferase family 4 protein [Candidatus Jingweiarchaeum tengchongense]MCW1306081.1 glycosyltransferase family 4 protein [Candidatus Jingweiarchaeum tengchongense]